MGGLLVVGGSKGIGKAIIQKELNTRKIWNLSRTAVNLDSVQQVQLDILSDELPDVEDISSLVYCPGSINLKPISSLSIDDFRADLEINLIGAIKTIKKYHRQLKKADNASITLFSTVAVAQGMPFHASVATAKAAIEGLTKSLAAELAPKIRVNCIAPSVTNTTLAAGLMRNEQAIDKLKARHPMKDILQAEEVAILASYLMSPSAKGMTGQILHLDGGLSALKI